VIVRLLLAVVWTATVLPAAAQLTLESIFLDGEYDGPDRPRLQWIEGGDALLRATDDDGTLVLERIDVDDGRTTPWLRIEPIADPFGDEATKVSRVVVAPGERHLLLMTNADARWRRSTRYDHWVLDRETDERWRLSAGGAELHADFDDTGSRVGFVREGRLHVLDLATRQVTSIGEANDPQVTWGDPDWVYEEEFDFSRAWWFAPGGERVALLRFDRTGVDRFPMVVTGDGAMPGHDPFDYPKAGGRNSTVTLLLHELGGVTSEIASVDSDDGYLVRAAFTPDAESLTYQVLDRDQKRLRMFVRSVVGDDARLVLEETADAWVEVDNDLQLLDDGTFLWTKRDTGFRQVWRGSLDGGALVQVSKGDFDVRSIAGANTDHAFVTTARTPVISTLERLDLDSGDLSRVGSERGWASADVAPDGQAFVHSWSTAENRTLVDLRDASGRRVTFLHEDAMDDLDGHVPVEIELKTIDVEGAPAMWGCVTRRVDFDPNAKHPVLIYVYGGPGAQAARDRWGGTRGLFHRMLVERGWVVVTADGRGSAGRGVDYETATYLNLGTDEIDDQVRLVDWLRTQSWVDPDAIAIHGSSYGGYASLGALIRGGGKLAAAIAAAPVTDWRFYDTGYTERYMLRPQDNPEGYAKGSWLDEVEGMQGRLLLIHGTGDDNVHDQNSHRLISALVDAQVPFDLMIYPDKAHSLAGKTTRYDLYRRHAEHLERWVAPVGTAAENAFGNQPAGR